MADGDGADGPDVERTLRFTPTVLFGARATVVLTLAVGTLSIATGVASIGTADVIPVVARSVPTDLRTAAGFTGTLTGFLTLTGALALRRGLRAGWYATAVLVPVTALQGVVQSSPFSFPLVMLSTLSLPILLLNRRQFDRDLSLSTTQIAAGLALVGVQVYGTAGTFALREEFTGVKTVTDAFWYTLVTASTVGYGDVTPVTETAKVFGISVVVLGTVSFAIALGALLGPAIEARIAKTLGRMTDSQLELIERHVLVLGYGDLTEPILTELRETGVEFVVVTTDDDRASELTDRGAPVVVGDPSDEDPLRRAQIEDARAVIVATNDDARDALSVLTARELRPDARIVAAATDRENVEKLRRAGADTVISPATIGGHLLIESALGAEDTEERADRIMENEDADGGTDLVGDALGDDYDPSR
jgi:voltage-gated potassium channel